MKENRNMDREVLFFKYCNGIASPEERLLAEKFIADSDTFADELKNVEIAVGIQKKIEEMESLDVHSSYQFTQNKIRKRGRMKKFTTTLYRIAAMLTIPLLISSITFGYMIFNKNRSDVVFVEVASSPGVVSRFELPDKSIVWLNSNSKLRYPVQFTDGKREVEIYGEGFFEVSSDRENPFYVITMSGIKVMAYGTRFNINSYENITEAFLVEGKIDLLNKSGLLKKILPGEEVCIDDLTGKLEVKKINTVEKSAWKDGKIIFRNMPLNKVFEQLSRRYNVEIVLHDEHNLSENYSPRRVTFTNETIQQIMSYLEIAAPIEWKINPTIQNNDSTLAKQRIDVWLKKK